MSTITFDFRHHYKKGERRASDPIAYKWDLGHVAEILVPVNATYEINYCFYDSEEAEAYAVESIEAVSDGGYKITAHVPNKYFERSGELQVYVIGTSDSKIIMTYEGYITIRDRIQPDDYVDDDPENQAISYIEQAKLYSEDSEAFARGTRNNTPVGSTDPAYHDNSKYYKELAETAKTAAETAASNASASETSAAASAAAAAAIVVVANDGMVVIDEDDSDTEYVVTYKVENHRLVATMTPAS